MTARTAVKALVVVALTAPLVGGLVGSSPAEANGTITSPKSGMTFSGVTVDIEATAGPTQTDLTLTDPVSKPAKPVVVASYPASFMGTGRLSYHLNTACWTHLKCTGSVPAPNGVWTVLVTGATERGRRRRRREPDLHPQGAAEGAGGVHGSGQRCPADRLHLDQGHRARPHLLHAVRRGRQGRARFRPPTPARVRPARTS